MRISKAGRRKSFKKGVACDDEGARVRVVRMVIRVIRV